MVYIAIFESYFDYFLSPWSSRSQPNAFGKLKQPDGSFNIPPEYNNDDLRQTIIEDFCLIISEYWLDPVRTYRPPAPKQHRCALLSSSWSDIVFGNRGILGLDDS